MKLSKIYDIKYLAQDFIESPQIRIIDKNVVLIFDYEKESGEYAKTGIVFQDVLATRHILNSDVELYMIEAYNVVAVVEASPWLREYSVAQGEYQHFIVYFDEYGAYEFLAADFAIGIDV